MSYIGLCPRDNKKKFSFNISFLRMIYCICIRKRRGMYGQIKPFALNMEFPRVKPDGTLTNLAETVPPAS